MTLHRLLNRQLQKAFGENAVVTDEWRTLIDLVDQAYKQADIDRAMIERSMDLSSRELHAVNQELRIRNNRTQRSYRISLLLGNDPDTKQVLERVTGEIAGEDGVLKAQILPLAELSGILKESAHKTEAFLAGREVVVAGTTFYAPLTNADKTQGLIAIDVDAHLLSDQDFRLWTKNLGQLVGSWLRDRETQSLVEIQRAQVLNGAKMASLGQMAGGIAHEINNPLAVILLLAEEIIDETPDPASPVRNLADTILKTGQRIAKIVSGLRTFSRDSSGDPLERVSLTKLFEQTSSLCGEKFKTHGVQLITDIPREWLIDCRATQISQVILNLLQNAYDAVEGTPDAWVKFSAEETESNIVFRVTDSGKPLNPDQREKLFQPFFTTKPIGKGTGLGLSVSLGIAKSHGGQLELDLSVPNTCFKVSLPKIPYVRETA